MKRKQSIRIQLITYFTLVILVTTALTMGIMLYASKVVLERTTKNYLISAVNSSTDDISFKSKDEYEKTKNASDIYIEYQEGYLEIDPDFLDVMHEVESGLYDASGSILYGKNPISDIGKTPKFEQSHIYQKEIHGITYFIYDRKLNIENIENLWIRGMVPITNEMNQIMGMMKVAVLFVPILLLVIIALGYFVSKKIAAPIHKMEEDTAKIAQGKDLSQRIDIGEGNDELHRLAEYFNEMIERLEKSFNAERQFTSDASHELRTPMSVIMAQTELTLEEERSNEEYKNALQVIHRQGKRMNKLIGHMLDYTRLEQRSKEYVMETMNLSELVTNVCEDMSLIRVKNITLDADVEMDIEVLGNTMLLSRALNNLIDNAYKYGVENGKIHVSLKQEKGQVLLTVWDNGIGISKEAQEKIFDRFYRADESRNQKEFVQGYGLGLSMVKKIVEMHHGEISVESKENQGSIFSIYLKL